ncbi:dipeptide ABC transporter (ATP-binding protein) [[Clostridium] ultunense Esp]|nr:dipeptide ABC transporter (ATP-binding protein) [[Clostridium] ultunense Esp]
MTPLLEVKNLTTEFHTKSGIIRAVNGISYTLNKGETVSIVGESGSGKSVSVLSILKLLPSYARITSGEIIFTGMDILRSSKKKMKELRGNKISMIFQDPMSSLNPTLTIGQQIMEPLLWHHKASHKEARRKALEMLEVVSIPSAEKRFYQYPFEFSGGMRQRAMIAMALISEPSLLIADEPTTSLDVTVQAQILLLIKKMQEKLGMSVILITHNLAVATMVSHYVIVMYAGKVVEKASIEKFLRRPSHPYTLGLLGSTPVLKSERPLFSIPGQPPTLGDLSSDACPFADRCMHKMTICEEKTPPEVKMSESHSIYCWLYYEGGEKVGE